MITPATPVLSLLLGCAVNHEAVTPRVKLGTALILSALLLHGFAGRRSVRTVN